MPNNSERTVGTLALKLRAARLQQLQEQDIATRQAAIANTQQQINQIPQIIQNQEALEVQRQNNIRQHEQNVHNNEIRLEVAAMNAAARAGENEKNREFKKYITDILQKGMDNRAEKAQKGQDSRSKATITSRESEGAQNRQNAKDIAHENNTVKLATATNPNSGNQLFPDIASSLGRTSNTNPENLPKGTLKEQQERKIALKNAIERAKFVENMLNDPKVAFEEDFGLAGTEVPGSIPIIGGASINSATRGKAKLQTWLKGRNTNTPEQQKVARQQQIMQAYANQLIPSLMDTAGKTITPLEAGGPLTQAGIDYDPENKKFLTNPFRNNLTTARAGMTAYRESLERELIQTMKNLPPDQQVIPTTGATSNPDQLQTVPMPPPPSKSTPQAPPVDPLAPTGPRARDGQSGQVVDPQLQEAYKVAIANVKAKRQAAIQQHKMSPEKIAQDDARLAKMLQEKYGALFNPADIQ